MARCGNCDGNLRTYCTRTRGVVRYRWLKCQSCGGTTKQRIQLDTSGRNVCDLVLTVSIESVEQSPATAMMNTSDTNNGSED
jgi:hypothetical protein